MIKNQQQANPEEAAIPAFLRERSPLTKSATCEEPVQYELDVLAKAISTLRVRLDNLEARMGRCLKPGEETIKAIEVPPPQGESPLAIAIYTSRRAVESAEMHVESLIRRVEV